MKKIPEKILNSNPESQPPLYKILTHPENKNPKTEKEDLYISHQLNYFTLEFYTTLSLIFCGGSLAIKEFLLKKKIDLSKNPKLLKGNKHLLFGCFGGLNLLFYCHYERRIRKLDFEDDLKFKWSKQLKDLKNGVELTFN